MGSQSTDINKKRNPLNFILSLSTDWRMDTAHFVHSPLPGIT